MRLVRTIDTNPDAGEAEPAEDGPPARRYRRYYVRPRSADDDGSKTAQEPVTWDNHTNQVTANAKRIAVALRLSPELQEAIQLAALFHDLGKKRIVWQRSIGNPNPTNWLAKSGGKMKPRELTSYRHEFGSLLEVLDKSEFKALEGKPELRDLVLHLIAVHHGRGRPCGRSAARSWRWSAPGTSRSPRSPTCRRLSGPCGRAAARTLRSRSFRT
jgi:CRISPR-associated endonuclease/helicase Cas3